MRKSNNPAQIAERAIRKYADARNCIEVMKAENLYDDERIGVVIRNTSTNCAGYKSGEIVLFRHDLPTRYLILETPLSAKDIRRERRAGSLLTTIGQVSGIPRSCVKELKYLSS